MNESNKKNIIKQSFINVFWPIKTWTILSYVADIITLASPFFLQNSIPKLWLWVCAICVVIGIIIVRFLFFLNNNINELKKKITQLEQDLADKNIWGEAIEYLRTAYSHIHLLRKRNVSDRNFFMETMIEFCDILQKFYNEKTNSSCCVSIKIAKKEVDLDNDEVMKSLSFENLCRDSHHPARDNSKYKETIHTVMGNSAYAYIIGKMLDNKYTESTYSEICYVNNDVKNDKNYCTTSIKSYDNNEIPYGSELVYPLIPFRRPSNYKFAMIGFICIDCKDENKFLENKYERPMISGIADGLYDVLISFLKEIRWNELNSQN